MVCGGIMSTDSQDRRTWLKASVVAAYFFFTNRLLAQNAPVNKQWAFNASAFAENVIGLDHVIRRAIKGTALLRPADLFVLLPLNPTTAKAKSDAAKRGSFVFGPSTVQNGGPAYNHSFMDDGIGRVTVKLAPAVTANFTASDTELEFSFSGAKPEIILTDIPVSLYMPKQYELEVISISQVVVAFTLYNPPTGKRLRLSANMLKPGSTTPALWSPSPPISNVALGAGFLSQENAYMLAIDEKCCQGVCEHNGQVGTTDPNKRYYITEWTNNLGVKSCVVETEQFLIDQQNHPTPGNQYKRYPTSAFYSEADAFKFLEENLHGKCSQ